MNACSWSNEDLPRLIEAFWDRRHTVRWIYDPVEFAPGNISVFLSCALLVSAEQLALHLRKRSCPLERQESLLSPGVQHCFHEMAHCLAAFSRIQELTHQADFQPVVFFDFVTPVPS